MWGHRAGASLPASAGSWEGLWMEQSHQLQQNSEIMEEQSWGSLLPVAGPHEAHGRGEIIASSEALGEYVDRVSQLALTM